MGPHKVVLRDHSCKSLGTLCCARDRTEGLWMQGKHLTPVLLISLACLLFTNKWLLVLILPDQRIDRPSFPSLVPADTSSWASLALHLLQNFAVLYRSHLENTWLFVNISNIHSYSSNLIPLHKEEELYSCILESDLLLLPPSYSNQQWLHFLYLCFCYSLFPSLMLAVMITGTTQRDLMFTHLLVA